MCKKGGFVYRASEKVNCKTGILFSGVLKSEVRSNLPKN